KAVAADLPPLAELTDGLLDALYLLGSRLLRRRRWVVAIDEHRAPFYGDRSAAGVTGGQRKHGSKYAHGYATCALVHHRHRFTAGLLALTGGERPHEVVAALLGQAEARGLKVRGVVLDSAFDSGETLLLLQQRGLSYAVPLRKKGKGDNRRNAAWRLAEGAVTRVGWRTERGNRPVGTLAVVLRRPGGRDKRVCAFGGWGPERAQAQLRRARLARRWYRKRFGIETSYRQMNQCKARTTKKDVAYRLLLVGLALLLRQAWAWLTWQLARALRLRPKAWAALRPWARLAGWLADLLKSKYREEKVIHLGSPLLPLGAGL
ncbi:MAG TPA: transposase, partial [Vicinamibacteria bacterium]|nr:transposase [Vicinamibacteria bacterium]